MEKCFVVFVVFREVSNGSDRGEVRGRGVVRGRKEADVSICSGDQFLNEFRMGDGEVEWARDGRAKLSGE